MTKQEELAKIKADIVKQKICPDLAAGATQLVFGDGDPDAELVFIGEAPGKNEDEQGLPFVGAAGKFLNEMLALIGLKREDVYITNIVKYRPPENRDPLPDEKTVFLPFLHAQLAVIKPKIVVTLGRHSMECFLPDLKISVCHGQAKRIRVENGEGRVKKVVAGGQVASTMQGAGEQRTETYGKYGEGAAQPATQQRAASDNSVGGSADDQVVTSLVILPLFHPAAALYNGGMRQTLIDDFMKIPRILAKLEQTPNSFDKQKTREVQVSVVSQPEVKKAGPSQLQLGIK